MNQLTLRVSSHAAHPSSNSSKSSDFDPDRSGGSRPNLRSRVRTKGISSTVFFDFLDSLDGVDDSSSGGGEDSGALRCRNSDLKNGFDCREDFGAIESGLLALGEALRGG